MARRRAIIQPETYTVEILGRRFPVTNMEDASRKVSYIIEQTGMGYSQIGAEFTIRDSRLRVLGYVSYNGKVWKGLPGNWPNNELMYDPYTRSAQEAPETEPPGPRREPFCYHHTHYKDYTRPGEPFVRCGLCHARRVDEEEYDRLSRPRRIEMNPMSCSIHDSSGDCRTDPATCRWVCDGAGHQGDPVCRTKPRHYNDTKSFFCDEARRAFLRDYRWDDRRGEWVERR